MTTRRTFVKGALSLLSLLGYVWHSESTVGSVLSRAPLKRHNCSFLASTRREMAYAIENGELPRNIEQIVKCPLCSEQMRVTAIDAFEQIRFDSETLQT